ncbi:zinc finger protein [Glonium stellatum]|uniref:Ubiquitin thioesterase OTU n=1 Tax=Glonium stellatum TaxID=574774 RepID=A0A8E2FCT4_9PEZI|nr:zinc finger protein [Glonium stellatum]
MRLRIRSPAGVSTITLDDSATVSDLLSSISDATSLPLFDLKWGFPPQPLDPSLYGLATLLKDTDLKLNGEQLIVIARETEPQASKPGLEASQPQLATAASLPSSQSVSFSSQASTGTSTSSTSANTSKPLAPRTSPHPSPRRNPATSSSSSSSSTPLSLTRKPATLDADPPEIPIPSHGGTLVLRVMPDDNSCLFRALGSAVMGDTLDGMRELRSLVAQGIQAEPELYSEAVLQQPRDEYCRWIQMASSWGGAIELGILAQNFAVEVCSINVQDLRVDRFNEGKEKRCILVYSGIHYDTIALSPSDPPHTKADLGAEFDQKIFDADDEEVLEKARDLCRVLQQKHYFTDTQKFDIACNQCGWKGKGENDAVKHATETNHYDFGEAG